MTMGKAGREGSGGKMVTNNKATNTRDLTTEPLCVYDLEAILPNITMSLTSSEMKKDVSVFLFYFFLK